MIHFKHHVWFENSDDASFEIDYLLNRPDFKWDGAFGESGREICLKIDDFFCYGFIDHEVNHSVLFGRTCFIVRLLYGETKEELIIKELVKHGIESIVSTDYGIKLTSSVKMDEGHFYKVIAPVLTDKPTVILA